MLSFLVLAAASYGLGAVLHRDKVGDPVQNGIFRFTLGLPMCALLSLGLGFLSLRLAEFILALVAFGTLILLLRTREKQTIKPDLSMSFTWIEWSGVAVTGGALLIGLAGALAPQTHVEAVVGALADSQDVARMGVFRPSVGTAYGLSTALFSVVFDSGGEGGAALLGWGSALLACGVAYVLGRWISGRCSGIVAAAAVASAPVFGELSEVSTEAFLLVAFELGALAFIIRTAETGSRNELWKTALLAGSGCGVAPTGYLIALFTVPVVTLMLKERRIQATVLYTGLTVLVAAPWFVWLIVSATNPFGALASAIRYDWSILSILRYPWDLVMRPESSGGWEYSPGSLVAGLGIGGLFLGGRRAAIVGVFSMVGGLALYCFTPDALMVLPFFAPMWVLAGVATGRGKILYPVVVVVLMASFAQGMAFQGISIASKMNVLTGQETREKYLERDVEGYKAINEFNDTLLEKIGEGRILTNDPRRYYYGIPMEYAPELLISLSKMSKSELSTWVDTGQFRYLVISYDFKSKNVPKPFYNWLQRVNGSIQFKYRVPGASEMVDGRKGIWVYEIVQSASEIEAPPVRLVGGG